MLPHVGRPQMGDVGRAQATSVSPVAQDQLTLLRGDHDGWLQMPAAAIHSSTMRVFCCICGKTRPSTLNTSAFSTGERGFVSHTR